MAGLNKMGILSGKTDLEHNDATDGEGRIRFSESYEEHYKVLSVASHEIMNYLSTIGSTYQYLDTRYPETQGFKFWNNLGTSVNYLCDFMKQTSLCRYSHFPHKTETTPQSIVELIYESLGECRYQDIIEHIYVNMNEPEAAVYCDPEHVASAAFQLILNAYEAVFNDDLSAGSTQPASASGFSDASSAAAMLEPYDFSLNDDGDPALDINVDITASDGTLTIAVTNHGQLDDEHAPTELVQPFFSTRANHSGCGLYIANIVCTAHDGYMTIDSRDGITAVTLIISAKPA